MTQDAEERARLEALADRAKTLFALGAVNWVWPDERNCFFTGLPVRPKVHANAHKTLWTQPPGCANKRHKKHQRAGMQHSGARSA